MREREKERKRGKKETDRERESERPFTIISFSPPFKPISLIRLLRPRLKDQADQEVWTTGRLLK